MQDLKNWLNHPFSADMPFYEWIALGALLGCGVTAWNIILMHIKGSI